MKTYSKFTIERVCEYLVKLQEYVESRDKVIKAIVAIDNIRMLLNNPISEGDLDGCD